MLCFDLSRETRYSVVAENTEYRVSRDIPICSLYILYARSGLTLDIYTYATSY